MDAQATFSCSFTQSDLGLRRGHSDCSTVNEAI